jgi:UDP-N-acetylmuramyl pentapeptide synthase
MLELGALSDACHEEAGERFAKTCGGHLFLFGKYALRYASGAARGGLPAERITVFPASCDTCEIARRVLPLLREGDTLLIKGSHATKAEEILKKLTLLLDQKAR